MAFVNDLLEESEKREYHLSTYQHLRPGACTIDREKNIRLHYTGHPHEDCDNHFFLFDYQGTNIKLSLHRTFIGDNTIHWRLQGIHIPDSLDKKTILEELKNALKVYQLSGYSIVPEIYDPLEVEVDFSAYSRLL